MQKRAQFPKYLFLRFLLAQLFLGFIIFLVMAVGVRIYIEKRLALIQSVEELPNIFNRFLILLSIGLPLAILLYTLWMGWRLVLPLGRLLSKTRNILELDQAQSAENPQNNLAFEMNALEEEELGEWSDLESALNRIQTDIKRKNSHLTREREETEAIISAISDAVLAVDTQQNLLFYNSQFLVLFGNKTMRGQQPRLSQLFRSEEVQQTFQETMKDGLSRQVNVALLTNAQSNMPFFSLSVAPLRQGNDHPVYGAVGVFHDVSELKRAEQIRIDFVANVSHELRTPLTSIKGYSQTLKDDLDNGSPAMAHKCVEIIERNVERLLHLVNDLLNLSSLESHSSLDRSTVQLKELTERVLVHLEPKRQEKEQKIIATYKVTSLEADMRRVEQVLFNLVENAIKYAPREKTIEIFWETNENGEVLLRVLDDGPGIASEHHARLFERFYRVDPARTRESGGTGLGLAIVKHIMQKHAGSVRVQSAPHKGTEFVCTFPAVTTIS